MARLKFTFLGLLLLMLLMGIMVVLKPQIYSNDEWYLEKPENISHYNGISNQTASELTNGTYASKWILYRNYMSWQFYHQLIRNFYTNKHVFITINDTSRMTLRENDHNHVSIHIEMLR
jgi:hypothetical protein